MSLTANVDPAFDRAFLDACRQIGCKPLHLLGVMMNESGVNPAAHNPHGNASGLIQFMPDTLRALGWKAGDQAFRNLSASAQLPYVVAFYRPWAKDAAEGAEDGEPAWNSPARLYQATFLPGTLKTARKPEDVIAAHGGRLGWAFDANAGFDQNGDGKITVGELSTAVMNAVNRNRARWDELVKRLGLEGEDDIIPDSTAHDVVSQLDVQRALNAWIQYIGPDVENYDPPLETLTEDGVYGPKTIRAVRAFQEATGVLADGRAGPETRAALAAFLDSPAASSKG